MTPSSPSPSKAYGRDYISVRHECNSVIKAGKDMTLFILKKGNHFWLCFFFFAVRLRDPKAMPCFRGLFMPLAKKQYCLCVLVSLARECVCIFLTCSHVFEQSAIDRSVEYQAAPRERWDLSSRRIQRACKPRYHTFLLSFTLLVQTCHRTRHLNSHHSFLMSLLAEFNCQKKKRWASSEPKLRSIAGMRSLRCILTSRLESSIQLLRSFQIPTVSWWSHSLFYSWEQDERLLFRCGFEYYGVIKCNRSVNIMQGR